MKPLQGFTPFLWLVLLSSLVLSACGGTSVTRVDVDEEIALSDRWNATDSRMVSDEMIDDMLSFPWLERWRQANADRDRQPTVIVLGVRNRSHEHIEINTFVNDLRRAMIRSGRVDFVAAGDVRDAIRDERQDQEFHSDPETVAQMGREAGANFALSGSIDSWVDQRDRQRVTNYQIDLVLIDMQTNREVWAGQKRLQKLQERSRFGR